MRGVLKLGFVDHAIAVGIQAFEHADHLLGHFFLLQLAITVGIALPQHVHHPAGSTRATAFAPFARRWFFGSLRVRIGRRLRFTRLRFAAAEDVTPGVTAVLGDPQCSVGGADIEHS